MKKKQQPPKIDAEGILRKLKEIRAGLPRPAGLPEKPPKPAARHDGKIERYSGGLDFETQAVVDGLESLADDVRDLVLEAEFKAFEQAMEIYYGAVELTRDGQNPELLPHVEEMRRAYEKSYGRPIPSREKKEDAKRDFYRARDKRK